MDLRQLEAFAAVMTAGSITGAGQLLGRSQPAITRAVQDLEQELGLQLFERSGPKVTPTSQAFALRSDVDAALNGAQQVLRRAQTITEDSGSEIRIGATPALAAGLLPAALARLPAPLLPGRIQLRSLLADQVVGEALAGGLDLGVVSLPLEHRGLHVHWIGQAPCVAVVAADSPLASLAEIGPAQLATQPLITLGNRYRLRGRIDAALAGLGSELHVQETNASLNAVQLARAGFGIALVDPVTALGIGVEGVQVKPLWQPVPFYFGLVSPVARERSAATDALVDLLEQVASELLPGFSVHPAAQHDALLLPASSTRAV